ncbi:MAG: PIN domain-containing protein [archaeon]
MEVLLDTSFMISCLNNRISFDLIEEKFGRIVVPIQVIRELENISKDKNQKLKDRDAASLALKIVEKLDYKKIDLSTKEVDEGIISYVEDKDIIVATLDKGLKMNLRGKKVLIITNFKKLVLNSKV